MAAIRSGAREDVNAFFCVSTSRRGRFNFAARALAVPRAGDIVRRAKTLTARGNLRRRDRHREGCCSSSRAFGPSEERPVIR